MKIDIIQRINNIALEILIHITVHDMITRIEYPIIFTYLDQKSTDDILKWKHEHMVIGGSEHGRIDTEKREIYVIINVLKDIERMEIAVKRFPINAEAAQILVMIHMQRK